MSQFAVDPATGDLVRSGGGMSRVSGRDEIAQWVRVRSRLILGECFLRTDLGVNLIGLVLAKGATTDEIAGEYRSAAIETPGVVEIGDVRVTQTAADRQARRASVSWSGRYSLEDLGERGLVADTFTVAVAS